MEGFVQRVGEEEEGRQGGKRGIWLQQDHVIKLQ